MGHYAPRGPFWLFLLRGRSGDCLVVNQYFRLSCRAGSIFDGVDTIIRLPLE